MPTGETLADATPSPEPPPSPTPTTATASASPSSTTRHRRHRTFSSSSSSSSSLSTVSSAASSPSPSPRGHGTTTTITTTTTSVPFSWEHHPGIPKARLIPAVGSTPSSSAPLPLPPPLRALTTSSSRPRHHHHAHVRRRRISSKKPPAADASTDPFAAALAECTRERGAGPDDAGLMDALFPARTRAPPASSSAPTSRRWSSIASSAGGVVGLLDLYGCKSAMAGGVAEGAFVVRRPVAVVRAGPGRAGRR